MADDSLALILDQGEDIGSVKMYIYIMGYKNEIESSREW